jgi:F-type H+-transporting ATPase subunit b
MSLDLDITYILVLGLLLLPLLILNGIVFKPFMALFAERHERLEGAVDRAEDMLEEAESEAKTFDKRIKAATSKGVETRNQIRAETSKIMGERLDEEKGKLQQKLEVALGELEKMRRVALADVHVEAESIAEATAAKLLGRSI